MEGQARSKVEQIEKLWSNIQNKNKKIIDKGEIKKIRTLIGEAKENKQRSLSQDEQKRLLNVEEELAKIDPDANPSNIPGAVTGKITGVGSH
ncbi:hypothetical protein BS78_K037500 [Paspalum vaginatum]|uniref:Uncharacterized protein n=1 Tax=Paspalum vaginatum TaxID=158149 RepID=A0A9W7X790_9POAL|nr:hypothetical protein BS78_K037500 [Paspalum vaginatum]